MPGLYGKSLKKLKLNDLSTSSLFLQDDQYCRREMYQTPANACVKSLMISTDASKPIEIRIVSGSAPAAFCCSSDNCECIMEAGCAMSVRLSPRLATKEIILQALTIAFPAASPPLRPKVNSAPAPSGQYFL